MFKSREIRWFTPDESKSIVAWFEGQNQTFNKVDSRTDFYLPFPERGDLGIKLREGNIEIKQRQGIPMSGRISLSAVGYFEDWTKWSFNAEKGDPLSESIIHGKKYNWLEVNKERMGVIITPAKNQKTAIVDISERVDSGCQLEYTRIRIIQDVWFSFGLEWFGEVKLEPDQELLAEIFGTSTFKPANSMGYGEFLRRYG